MSDRSRLRLIVLRVLVLSLLLTLLGRLWYLQVLAGPQYQQAAADNQVRDIVAAAPRGVIVDDTGQAWATNQTALVIAVDRIALLRQKGCGSTTKQCPVLVRLADLLHVPYQELDDKITLCGPSAPTGCWNGSPYEPIPVSELKNDTASTRLALQILDRQEDFPGVSAKPAAVRTYLTPDGALASHVLGYLGPISPRGAEEAAQGPAGQPAQRLRRADRLGVGVRRVPARARRDHAGRGRPPRRGDQHPEGDGAAGRRQPRHQPQCQRAVGAGEGPGGCGRARTKARQRQPGRTRPTSPPEWCSTRRPGMSSRWVPIRPTTLPCGTAAISTRRRTTHCARREARRCSTRRSRAPIRPGRRSDWCPPAGLLQDGMA